MSRYHLILLTIFSFTVLQASAGVKYNLDTSYEYNLKPGENINDKIRRNLFVKVSIDKVDCYIGEPIIATYKLYSRLNSQSRITKQPVLSGFNVRDMFDIASVSESVETMHGKPFKVHTLRKTQLVPLQTGTLALDPLELESRVHLIKGTNASPQPGNQLDDVFDQFLKEESAPTIDQLIKILSDPVSISVKPLPEINRPLNFNGTVGRFTIRASLVSKIIDRKNAGILRVELNGKGNLSFIEAPEIKWPINIEAYSVRSVAEPEKDSAPLEGKKVFEYTFIPTNAGKYSISPVAFSFFDPYDHMYKTIQTEPIVFETASGRNTGKQQKTVSAPASGLVKKSKSITVVNYSNAFEFMLAVFSLFFFSIVYNKQNHLLKNTNQGFKFSMPFQAGMKQPAVQVQTDDLQSARALLEKGDHTGFYTELNHVLWNLLSLKLQLPPSRLNKFDIAEKLRLIGWSDEKVGNLHSALTECERHLYLSDYQSDTHVKSQLERAVDITTDLQNI